MENKKQMLEIWNENGFYNTSMFSDIEVSEMKQEAMKLLNSRDSDWENSGPDGSQPYKNPHNDSKLFFDMVKNEKIVKMVETLMGNDLGIPDCKIQGTQTWIYFKPPGQLGRDVHQNIFYSHCTYGEVINISIAIDDADEGNGCLYWYPGSHKEKLCYPIPDSSHTEFDSKDDERIKTNPTEWPNERGKPLYVPGTWIDNKWVDKYPKTYVPIKAGSITPLDSHVLHGSDANNSKDRWRRSFLIQYQKIGRISFVGESMHRESIDVYN